MGEVQTELILEAHTLLTKVRKITDSISYISQVTDSTNIVNFHSSISKPMKLSISQPAQSN